MKCKKGYKDGAYCDSPYRGGTFSGLGMVKCLEDKCENYEEVDDERETEEYDK